MVFLQDFGLTISVVTGGQPAREYDDPSANGDADPQVGFTSVHDKYIEVAEDAAFSIRIEISNSSSTLWAKGNNGVTCWPYIDGHQGSGRNFDRRGTHVAVIEGVETSAPGTTHDMLRRWRFQKIETIDDANRKRVEQDARTAKELGVVQIKVWRSQLGGDVKVASVPFKSLESFSIAEKALKGKSISHGTRLGDAERVSQRRFCETTFVDKYPILIVNFRYRSREALRNELIIPRSPSPPAADAADVGIDDLSPERMRQLAMERLAEIKNEEQNLRSSGLRVKREVDLTGDENNPPARPFKIIKSEGGRPVIDLTDD